MSVILRMFFALALCLGLSAPAAAGDDKAIVLTVEGNIEGERQTFTIADLEAMGTEQMTTTTPWHDGAVTFEGVAMARLLQHVKAQGETTEVTALNAYFVDIPTEDLIRNGAVLALKRDGNYMAVTDKGPLFLIYPFDANPALRTEVHYSRSVWQVSSIAIR
ncbi:MAG: oxidoreductase [Pannonibacter sp.]